MLARGGRVWGQGVSARGESLFFRGIVVVCGWLTASSEFQMWDIFVSDKDGPWAQFHERTD